jgi:catechol 2,3-dioxygenase-like lactoylglutathione lyase family enzyme
VSLGALTRVELPCQDLQRQRDFYARVLGLAASSADGARFALAGVELVLRPRGNALFASARGGEGGVLLAFPVPTAELDRWHRRMLTARVAVLEPPSATARLLRIADPEGNVIELFAAG